MDDRDVERVGLAAWNELYMRPPSMDFEDNMVRKMGKAAIAAMQDGWRNIDTANPKDGDIALLVWDGFVVPGRYLDNSSSIKPWKGWRTFSGEITPRGKPTKWQPLPAPPDSGDA